ncbi:MAG: diaminopimelate epimerase [Mariprofundaceae bacterium]|nr:diaminopimelate epimerase [Mariprofundaceae bacterium]
MMIPFTKMQAQGNDFIVLNALEHDLPALSQDFIRTITERRYGIGCDQLLVLLPSKEADAAMRIFNNDGSEAANCGTGLRCAADLLLAELNIKEVRIALADRVVLASYGSHGVSVEMGEAVVEHKSEACVQIDMGNPHSVFFEATEDFPSNRNIEMITGQVADHVYIDIIERGAGRTRACGTGACATAAAIWTMEGHERSQIIEMPGGHVTVSGNMNQMILEGSVAIVFTGHYYWQTTQQTP